MSIHVNYNRTVDVERIAEDAGPTESYAAHLSGVPCHIQPLDDSFTEQLTGSYGKDWLLFCDATDILEGDLVTDDADVEYKVVGVESFHFLNQPRHMEVRLRKSHS